MQPSVHLNQRDIVRLQNAIGKLMAIGDALLGKNGHGAVEAPKKKRKRRKRMSGETPAQPTRRRGRPPVPPSGSSSPE